MEGEVAGLRISTDDLKNIQTKHVHLLVIPLCIKAISHVSACFLLAVKLAKQGITVTFLTVEDTLSYIHSQRSPEELQSLGIRLAIVEYDESLLLQHPEWSPPVRLSWVLERAVQPYFKKFALDRASGVADQPTCIMADFFCYWAQTRAEELNLPNYVFYPSGANLARLHAAFPTLVSEGKVEVSADDKVIVTNAIVSVPGLPPLPSGELPKSLRQGPVSEALNLAHELVKATGIIINTFYEFEYTAIEPFMAACDSKMKVPKLFPIGPLASAQTVTVPTGRQTEECMEWLDSQPASSVIYICFGSKSNWTAQIVHELALALEASNYRFLWVLNQKGFDFTSLAEVLPAQFQARVGERGRIATFWVPQVKVLLHRAVSCFMSHCGWNSIMESVTSGVPMLCWPRQAEQHLNCRHIVDMVQAGVQIIVGDDGAAKQQEIERALSIMMDEEDGKSIRKRMQDLKMKAAAAAAPGGSSSLAFQDLVEDMNCT
uniref:Glycosyltransferase n=1 Tax=Marchantia emarginata TaxID=179062 RepID=A0A8F9RTW1_9MARC|nr:UGT1 [Marchantia emarginata]